jgi:HSP20 family molecular chaperone IbpA
MSLLNTLMPSLLRSPARESRDSDRGSDFGHTVKPAYEVKETPDAYGVTVYLPGVGKDGVELTAEEGYLRIIGRRGWKQPEGWISVYRETADEPFELVLSHDNAVNVDTVAADLRDGVLRVSLPKHEAIKPRKIAIN